MDKEKIKLLTILLLVLSLVLIIVKIFKKCDKKDNYSCRCDKCVSPSGCVDYSKQECSHSDCELCCEPNFCPQC